MKRVLFLAVFLFCTCAQATDAAIAETGSVVRTAAGLSKVVDITRLQNVPFDITATVTSPLDTPCWIFAVNDKSGAATLHQSKWKNPIRLHPGDVVRAKGFTKRYFPTGFIAAMADSIEVTGHGAYPQPVLMDHAFIRTGKYNNRLVKIKGPVRDAFHDEIDSNWNYVQIQCGTESVYVCFIGTENDDTRLQSLIDSEVSAIGLYTQHRGVRQFIGFTVYADNWESISVTRPAPKNPFDAPELDKVQTNQSHGFINLKRHRTAGRVIAVWHEGHMLLRTRNRAVVRVDLIGKSSPKYGDLVEVVGCPETDLYRRTLSRAIWRPVNEPDSIGKDPAPTDVTVRQLTTTELGERAFQTNYHGLPIRLVGTVISLPSEADNTRLGLRCENQIIPVDASSCPEAFADVKIGCMIAASGTCLMESANWHPNAPFPHIERFSIIVRTPDDVEILSYPPWWTTGRLFAVIGALLALLSGIFIWNRMLNRLAERRGRELADEKLAHVTSDLKVYERTRLAVELHDSLSQNLTGVSLAIRAANRLADSDSDGMRQSLNVAAKALDSCRDELRNCLWDLRNQTLEETDMNEAIRQTLAPHIGDNTKLSVRFNVSRERLSDNTAHCILRIIRELVSNAIRHGGASAIKIAGSIEEDRLLFSVCDNGCGFDPDNRPNAADGHFGLQGIQDRVDGFEGELSIKSAPDAGAKVTVSIKVNIPKQAD